MRWTREIRTAIILLILQTISAKPNKSTAPAVFEVINEHARMDSIEKTSPYKNPLAGNSQQNAKIHAQHQQAMFNAERYRQHRAQVMRWSNQPPKQQVDSYMQAYHESQENHHLALEQMQATMKEKRVRGRPEKLEPLQINTKEKRVRGRPEQRKTLKDKAQMDPIKITRADVVSKNRNHRSFGSIHTNVIKKYKIHTYPGPTYDQGVTIKPNGNVGLNNHEKEQSNLLTIAIPSKTQYDYPKLYSQMHPYQTANDIDALNTLLSKQPQEQLTQFNTLIHNGKETKKDTHEKPVDLIFYLKEQPTPNDETVISYPGPYAAEYINHKDHTPITEEVDDVQDNKDYRIRIQSTVPTILAQVDEGVTTPKNNYFKPEVEQTGNNDVNKNLEYIVQEKPSYETLQYKSPLNFYSNGPRETTEGIKYLKTQPTGVQHLSPDGTGVSAYGDNDVSINSRRKRELDTDLFIFENYTVTTEKIVDDKTVIPIQNQTLINVKVNCNLTMQNINDSISDYKTFGHDTDDNETLPTPEALKRNRFNSYRLNNLHNVGEAFDYDYSYDDDDLESGSNFEYIDENDYNSDYESTIPDYDYEIPRPRPKTRPSRSRRPINHKDIDGSFSNRFSRFRHPNFEEYHPEPANRDYSQQYVPFQYTSHGQYGLLTNSNGQISQYGPPVIQTPLVNQNLPSPISDVVHAIQPVYMLTQAQMKELLSAQKMNIQHLDVFQVAQDALTKPMRPRRPRHRKPRRRYPKRKSNKLGKLKKLRSIIRF